MRPAALTLLAFLAPSTAFAQSTDSQTLQALLQEIRQIRNDLYGMTLVAQRVQILLYRIQLQEDAARRTALRYDQKAAEERLSSLQNPNERAPHEEVAREMKRRAEMWSAEESSYRAAEAAAGSDLRNEQLKLLELQQRLDRLEQQLENYPRPAK